MIKSILKTTLCAMAIGLMILSACSSNDNAASTAASAPDSTELISTPSVSPEKTSIFDELASDMVYVETDSGGFYLCKYEVSQRLWVAVMGENPSQMQGDDLPVEQVDWNDCQAFIARLNVLTGKRYRLPTEAEWEYACKGGRRSKGYQYSGSNDIDAVAWYDGNSEEHSHPVGQKQPNELGLYDMSGNVWEWCQDMHESTGMCRGGSWIHNARNCDPTLPNETPRAFKINSLGLRLAL
ncbi:MAG: formylglycine-generating enzyme family protein [Bacteroidales bacterium]|nr:formylglycine-generating enzyme family protein [Bacteroidales bacterium]